MHSDITFRFFEEDDVNYLEQFYSSSTQKLFDKRQWTWQYIDNYASRGDPVAVICLDAKINEFVGVIHSTPTIKRYNGQDYYCTVGSDAYVRPEYRGRGVYNYIAKTVLTHEELLGSMRFSFYNRITRAAKTSPSMIMDTSISMKILNTEKVSKIFFGETLKGVLVPYIYKAYPVKTRNQTDLTIEKGNLTEYTNFYSQWSESSDTVHTPRTRKYLEWRYLNSPSGEPFFYSVYDRERLVGYFAVVVDDRFESYDIQTLNLSDYIIKDNNPELFGSAVTGIIECNQNLDLVVARPFSTPYYQKKLIEMGFLDSMHFPLNQLIKPGSLGIRIYNKECRDFGDKPWYLTQADCF